MPRRLLQGPSQCNLPALRQRLPHMFLSHLVPVLWGLVLPLQRILPQVLAADPPLQQLSQLHPLSRLLLRLPARIRLIVLHPVCLTLRHLQFSWLPELRGGILLPV